MTKELNSGDLLSQGAEAKIFIQQVQGKLCIVKERFQKNYRHQDLDKHLTRTRIRAESKALGRCTAAGILVPQVINTDIQERKITLEYFDKAITVKEYINDLLKNHLSGIECTNDRNFGNKLEKLGTEIGEVIGKMHANNIIHGDLTTSNMLINPVDENRADFDKHQLVMIDFGLSTYSQSPEDKGVDLYVLERALLSAHSTVETLFDTILKAYESSNPQGMKAAIASFEDVRARGRKRTMIG